MKAGTIYSSSKKIISYIILLLLVISVSSCIKTDTSDEMGNVVVVNAAETSNPQDFYIDNNKINSTGISFGQTLGYTTVSIGVHQLQFKTTANSTLDGSGLINAQDQGYYSVFYTDDKTTVTATDDRTPPQAGKVRIRLINLSEALTSNIDFGPNGGTSVITALPYRVGSSYYDIDPAATFSINVNGSSTAILTIPPTVLLAGHIYCIYMTGATQATLNYHTVTEL